MTAPAAIRAVFAEWRMVKTRKVLALIFEVPLEQQAEVLTMLGAPMPDAEIWCGIARMAAIGDDEQAIEPASPATAERAGAAVLGRVADPGATSTASQRGKERYANSTPMEQALIRAARLPEDERFRTWAAPDEIDVMSRTEAAAYIREVCCHGESRSLIAEVPACYERFLALETEYKLATGQMAEPR